MASRSSSLSGRLRSMSSRSRPVNPAIVPGVIEPSAMPMCTGVSPNAPAPTTVAPPGPTIDPAPTGVSSQRLRPRRGVAPAMSPTAPAPAGVSSQRLRTCGVASTPPPAPAGVASHRLLRAGAGASSSPHREPPSAGALAPPPAASPEGPASHLLRLRGLASVNAAGAACVAAPRPLTSTPSRFALAIRCSASAFSLSSCASRMISP
mmetsp:Transcript_10569/g.43706  ORF Transcript_10569/g.43706 Transcript_10569/m.43706 type:complete len:207 (+) Transcript_10569:2777-3397(+)